MLLIFQEPVIPADLATWLMLILIGLCGCLGHTTLNKGAQLIDASRTSVLRNADIAFVLIWQIALLGEYPTGWSIIGVILICSSTLVGTLTNPKGTTKIDPQDTELDERQKVVFTGISVTGDNKG